MILIAVNVELTAEIRLSMVLRKRTIMHYTPYMEDCCTSLSQRRDVPSDQLIAPFVEIQVLQRKISDTFCYHDISTCDIRGDRALQITVRSFSRDLDVLKKTIGSTHKNPILVQHIHFLEVWIHEVALYNELWQNSFIPARLTQPETGHSTQFSMQRTAMLWQLVAATVSFHDLCLSIESAELLHFPFSWWAETSYVFIIQVRTVFIDFNAGVTGREQFNLQEHDQAESLEADFRKAAEKEAMIPHMLDVYIDKLAPVTTQLIDDDGNRYMVYSYGVLLKSIQAGYERRIRPENRPGPRQFETQQKQSSLSQLSHPEVRSTDIQGLMPPEISDSQSFATSQIDLQFDLAEPGLDEFVWNTMMNDFSFFTPQNGPSL
jgi:hypothetical protein